MRKAIFVVLGASAFISSTAALSIGAGSAVSLQGMDRNGYYAALAALDAARDAALARCASLAAPGERDVCRAEAAAAEMVRSAEVEQAYRRTERSSRALQRARIEARYQVARAHCQALGGFKRDKCHVTAHAVKGRALLDAAAPYEARF
jgi:hypothetical protein